MNLLLDIYVVIWLLAEQSPLQQKTRTLLADRTHSLTVSVASIWEISRKQSLGRLTAPDNMGPLLELNRVRIMPVTTEHAFTVRSLPHLHGDPFDRMLVVQTLLENLKIVTHDKKIEMYSVPCMMV